MYMPIYITEHLLRNRLIKTQADVHRKINKSVDFVLRLVKNTPAPK